MCERTKSMQDEEHMKEKRLEVKEDGGVDCLSYQAPTSSDRNRQIIADFPPMLQDSTWKFLGSFLKEILFPSVSVCVSLYVDFE